jgi:WD40 repeat protein
MEPSVWKNTVSCYLALLLILLLTESKEPTYIFNPIGSKATVCAFTARPNIIITGHESGKVALFDVKTGEEIENNERAHGDVVTDLQLSKDRTYCITSSKDKSARVNFLRPFGKRLILSWISDT